jgi:hypothetical protein
MAELHRSGARGVDRLSRARVGLIGSAASEFHWLGRARLGSIGSAWFRSHAGVHVGRLAPRVMDPLVQHPD